MFPSPLRSLTLCSLLIATATSACQPAADAKAAEPNVSAPGPATTHAPGKGASAAGAGTDLPSPAKPHPALDAYERVRQQLADDDIAGAVQQAGVLANAAEAARASAAAAAQPHWDAMAAAARALSSADASAANAVRKQFGEVSRALIGLLLVDGELARGRPVFECPMAQGYQKWVQVQPRIENPYMGKRMLRCGGSTSLSL